MKKKGFTLIELLAVIVVLAVIALIATPTILGVIEKTKKGALRSSAYGLIEAANLYYAQYDTSDVVRVDIENNQQITTGNKLLYKGNVETATVLINEAGKVLICVNDGNYSAYKNYNDQTVTVIDKKTCTVPESNSQVYLDGTQTIDEYTNQELTKLISELQEKVAQLESETENLRTDSATSEELEIVATIANSANTNSSLDKKYPIGSIYVSTDSTNPSETLGGTWVAFGSGKTLVGVDASNSNFSTAEKTGGSSTVTLTSSNLPSHTHSIPALTGTAASAGAHTHKTFSDASNGGWSSSDGSWANFRTGTSTQSGSAVYTGSSGAHTHTVTTTASTTGSTGSASAVSIQNPYITVYMWKRTA